MSADTFDLIVILSDCPQNAVVEGTPVTELGKRAGQGAMTGGRQAAAERMTGGNGGGRMTVVAGTGKLAARAGI